MRLTAISYSKSMKNVDASVISPNFAYTLICHVRTAPSLLANRNHASLLVGFALSFRILFPEGWRIIAHCS